ncbi:uncharacterized protein LOC122314630 isoform X2 [Carya illinoinensis]|uniref:PGG domain-containing protein n=1 Tax=Carya illinoinensis TaxID=32201 RepID=A0A8T1RN22_CARIL|nr:uncharacterized protein LOC122314630 isoform X2 [Carya illinoinensis]KAG6667490.1 hypothetical protein CIPAW_01G104800 [Carya illinoinensis]KAG6667492.1 hypothetical protein CIPAW_01G104800 [Carya illinoinensis]
MTTNILSSTIVLEALRDDNYENWSACIQNYFLAQDLWDMFETTTEPPKPEQVVEFKGWRKKNAAALHAIQISCGVEILSKIKDISSAKTVWYTLAKLMCQPPNPKVEPNNPGYSALKEALQSADWETATDFLKHHPNSKTAKITTLGKTALHVSVAAGHLRIVEELMELFSEDELEVQDNNGNTALMETTYRGQYKMAERMLRKNKKLIRIRSNGDRYLPVVKAMRYGHIKLARYLYSLTPLEDLVPENGTSGTTLCKAAIFSKTFDIALDLIRHCPRLALATDGATPTSPLHALASMPSAFPSGNRLVFWKRWISSCIHIQSSETNTNEVHLIVHKEDQESQSDVEKTNRSSVRGLLCGLVSKLISLIDTEHLYKMKLVHEQSHELLRLMCKEVSNSYQDEMHNGEIYSVIHCAIKEGIFEFVRDVLKANPDLLLLRDENKRNVFMFAVQCRQAKIFSLVYGLNLKNRMLNTRDIFKNKILHLAGMPPISSGLDRIQGAALQMQREVQWFKEVQSVIPPRDSEVVNRDNKTPRELFIEQHKDLLKEGEKWMKDTANSCTVVAALILTIMFAAAFTVPGGNNQGTGLPVFFNKRLFMLFMVSDSLSLFSSVTSVLMFLGILTSRYTEEDFLIYLPTKMIIGLSTLFFSIAAMMIAFSSGLLLILDEQSFMVIPAICFASIPVALFVLMQFPLLVDMFISTYGSGIFDRKMKPWL